MKTQSVARAQRALSKSESCLLKALRDVSGFASVSAALKYVYAMKAKHRILDDEDVTAALLSKPIPDVGQFFSIIALVDAIVTVQYQRSVWLQNVKHILQ